MKSALVSLILGTCLTLSSAFAADVDGDWSLAMTAAEGASVVTMSVAVDGENATATIGTDELNGTYKDGELKLKGPMYVPEAGMSSTLDITAKLDGDELKGSGVWDMYALDLIGKRK